MAADPNEVQSYLRGCKDVGFLQAMLTLCETKAAKLTLAHATPAQRKTVKDGKPEQAVMTTAPHTEPTTAEEQCAINNRLIDDMLVEPRPDERSTPTPEVVDPPKKTKVNKADAKE